LLLVGWIIGVADIFERYEEVCVHEALREVENMVRNSKKDNLYLELIQAIYILHIFFILKRDKVNEVDLTFFLLSISS